MYSRRMLGTPAVEHSIQEDSVDTVRAAATTRFAKRKPSSADMEIVPRLWYGGGGDSGSNDEGHM